MFRNVMVPVDGSTFSREAVLQGLRIASQSGARLRLVRVAAAPPVLTGTPDAPALSVAAIRQLHSTEQSELYSIAAECRAHSTVEVTASLERGPVVDSLIGYARRHNVDLIVMRSHARSGIARVWFGSVADQLIRESGIPVLVVRPPSFGTALESGFHFRRIVVPLDGTALARQALEPAAEIARLEHASLVLLRVVPAWETRPHDEVEASAGPASAAAVIEAETYLNSLGANGSLDGIDVTRRVVIASDIPSAILGVAEVGEADLVAIATRGRGALKRATSGSVADVVMRESAVSTLVVHPTIAVSGEFDTALSGRRVVSGQRA
jgi:nucleotide-binding universal stress UspA family protein